MTSAFENLCGPTGPLRHEPPDNAEYDGLVRSGLTRLRDASIDALGLESRFDLVYGAAHALCLAALRRKGYRAKNRYVVFQLVPHTLGLGPEIWRVLAKGHELRNLSEYEGDIRHDDRIVLDMLQACRAVATTVQSLTCP